MYLRFGDVDDGQVVLSFHTELQLNFNLVMRPISYNSFFLISEKSPFADEILISFFAFSHDTSQSDKINTDVIFLKYGSTYF